MNKINILIAIPSPDVVLPEFALDNLPSLIAYTKKLEFVENVWISYQKGVRTDKNRNMILQRALDQGNIDYILWLDADMLFPHTIVEQYFQLENPEIIGCLYFKRGDKFEPVVYTKSEKPFVYKMVDPTKIPSNAIAEVDGLGFGGMMVSMELYKRMGLDAYSVYGEDFHIPYKTGGNQLTHDINFCRIAQEKYNARIHCHMGVRPGHIGDQVVTIDTWLSHKPKLGRIREQNINSSEYWDKKYENRPQEYDNTTDKQLARWSLAREFIKETDSVLDVGCGLGYFLETLENESVTGVDISEYAIKTAEKRLQRGNFKTYNVDTDKFPFNEHYDVIFSGETLEHVNYPDKIFGLARERLKEGGRLILTTPNENGIDSPEHVNSFNASMLENLAKAYGLTPIRTQKIFEDRVLFFVAVKQNPVK